MVMMRICDHHDDAEIELFLTRGRNMADQARIVLRQDRMNARTGECGGGYCRGNPSVKGVSDKGLDFRVSGFGFRAEESRVTYGARASG